jgi:hypothetical protein
MKSALISNYQKGFMTNAYFVFNHFLNFLNLENDCTMVFNVLIYVSSPIQTF